MTDIGRLKREPAWMTAAVDQRLAMMTAMVGGAKNFAAATAAYEVVLTPLAEPAEDSDVAMDHWANACDNCKKYLPRKLITGHVDREIEGRIVVLTFGACKQCLEAP